MRVRALNYGSHGHLSTKNTPSDYKIRSFQTCVQRLLSYKINDFISIIDLLYTMKDKFGATVSTYGPLFLPVQRRLTSFSEFGGSVYW